MKINVAYLKKFAAFDLEGADLKELLASIGLETAETLQVDGQTVLEIEITPNRPDWLSHYGVAREIAAKNSHIRFQPMAVDDVVLTANEKGFAIYIENDADCWRYSGVIVRDVQVGESDLAVQKLLVSFGLRPINNIVDISNLVMMTCGQPLHIFDLERLQGKQIRVRRARKNENIRLLDGRDVALDENFLLIADALRPLALAGIMGGLDSGITAKTRHIFIESACFDPLVIRRASHLLGFKTDASYRFERGMDVAATIPAIKMALLMLGQKKAPFYFQDVYGQPLPTTVVPLAKDYPGRLTGIAIEAETSAAILQRLGFKLQDEGSRWLVHVPSYRVDISSKQDLVEEIIRIHGYEHLQSQMPLAANPLLRIDRERETIQSLKNQLVDVGFNEVINYVFQSPEENALFDPCSQSLSLKNPLGKDFSMMKNSLLAGLLKNTALNANQDLERIALFEIGNAFGLSGGEIHEKKRLAISVFGLQQKKDWRCRELAFDFSYFKSVLVMLGKRLRLEFAFKKHAHQAFVDSCCFAIEIDGRRCGLCGEAKPEFCRYYKLDKPVFAAEIDVPALLREVKENRFQMWKRFPTVRRDFTFLMAKTISYENLRACVERLRPEVLENFELTDVFQGSSIPADMVSFSMAFTYRSGDRTLTGDEVNGIHQEFIKQLVEQLHLIQR
ncbi:MAG: phenylalanine--tRNA ligase subunit beta [Candidatus Aminicenantes bacterium]|nr:phenylalanine--tRNA ligase subunit beta [Candidatus Aminicenantes bacterium]